MTEILIGTLTMGSVDKRRKAEMVNDFHTIVNEKKFEYAKRFNNYDK